MILSEKSLSAPVLDRRLSNRVLARWMIARGDRRVYPSRSHIDPRDFGKDWVNCVLIQLGKDIDRSRILAVGQNLRLDTRSPIIPTRLSDYGESSLLRLTVTEIPTLIEQRKLISFGGSAAHKGRPILYRSIILPLSDNDKQIDGVLGAINFREADPVRDGDKIEPLTIEMLGLVRSLSCMLPPPGDRAQYQRRWEALTRNPTLA